MKFLDGKNVKGEIRRLVSTGPTLKIAVAYWGKGATKELGLDKLPMNALVTVICDLTSGACNPEEISYLRKKIGADAVKKLDGLHAKVWLTENGAIVGSSNASANGLGFEGDETSSLIEANFFIKNQIALNAIEKWFDGLKPTDITPSDLKNARELWKKNRLNRPIQKAKNILEAITQNANYFGDLNLSLLVYDDKNLDDWAVEELNYQKKVRKNNRIECWQHIGNPPPNGSHILSIFVEEGKAERPFLYRVLQDDPLIKKKTGNILLCESAKSFLGIPLGDYKIWKAAAVKAMKDSPEGWEGDISLFAKKFILKK